MAVEAMPDTQLVATLSADLETRLSQRVDCDNSYALLDFPNHSNVGDSAIWLGELQLLERMHRSQAVYVSTFSNFNHSELDEVLPRGTIYLHGGGNFGDLYPRHQAFREKIMERYGSRVVQLPQSLHYSENADFSNIRRLARGSGALVCARDAATFARMSELGFDPLLAPDSALCLGPLRRPVKATQEILFLKRTDKESREEASGTDWLEEPSNTTTLAKVLAVLKLPFKNRRRVFYRVLAEMRVNRGLKLLSLGHQVVTDRLHAHILSILLGIPHVAVDNSTGKIHAFIDEWTHRSPLVSKAASVTEAMRIATHRDYRDVVRS